MQLEWHTMFSVTCLGARSLPAALRRTAENPKPWSSIGVVGSKQCSPSMAEGHLLACRSGWSRA